jgi:transcriptional regulator with XRE-family HTH domain
MHRIRATRRARSRLDCEKPRSIGIGTSAPPRQPRPPQSPGPQPEVDARDLEGNVATARKKAAKSGDGAKRARASTAARRSKPSTPPASARAKDASGRVARDLRWWAGSVFDIASSAADMSLNVAKMTLRKPSQRAALERAGALLRGFREAAGLSLRDVGAAIDLNDPTLLEAAEGGKIALPFEIILRLAAVLGKNDPLSFVMNLTRTQNPELWKTLEALGVGKLVLQVGREREFANIFRADNEARRLSDHEFAEVLTFMKAAFDLAMSTHRKRARRTPVTPSTD